MKSKWRNNPENHLKYRIQNFISSLRRTKLSLPDKDNLVTKLSLALKKGVCIYCKMVVTTDTVSLDHRLPLARGGDNSLINLHFICKKCNLRKGVFTHIEYVSLLRFLSPAKRTEMKKILLTRLGMSNFRFGGR